MRRSRKLLFALLDELRAKGYPSEQTTFGGFSQGCLMSIEVGLRYPHRLAGIVGISGYICEPEKLVEELSPVAMQQRLLITHGTFDDVVPCSDAHLIADNAQCAKTVRLYEGGDHRFSDPLLIDELLEGIVEWMVPRLHRIPLHLRRAAT